MQRVIIKCTYISLGASLSAPELYNHIGPLITYSTKLNKPGASSNHPAPMVPRSSLQYTQQPVTGPYLEQFNPGHSHCSILIRTSHKSVHLQRDLILQISLAQLFLCTCHLPHVIHAPRLTHSFEQSFLNTLMPLR